MLFYCRWICWYINFGICCVCIMLKCWCVCKQQVYMCVCTAQFHPPPPNLQTHKRLLHPSHWIQMCHYLYVPRILTYWLHSLTHTNTHRNTCILYRIKNVPWLNERLTIYFFYVFKGDQRGKRSGPSQRQRSDAQGFNFRAARWRSRGRASALRRPSHCWAPWGRSKSVDVRMVCTPSRS